MRLNWCERHLIETCFPDLFFSDESTFYLDIPVGARWVKDKENYIHAKNKGRKIGAWAEISSIGKTSLYFYEQNMNTENSIKYWKKLLKRWRNLEIFQKISYFFKLTMQDIIGQLKHLNFIMKII